MNAVAPGAEPILAAGDVRDALSGRGYRPDGAPFAIGRPDRATVPLLDSTGAPVVAKIYSDDGGAACFDNMRRAWSSSFGERRIPPGLPRPIEYLAEQRALVLERVAGRALAEMGPPRPEAVRDAMGLLAALHGSDARPTRRRSTHGIVRSLRRKVERLSRREPALGPRAALVVDRLEESGTKGPGLVPAHGDFSPRNVLVGPGRTVLIDWDRFQLADPARDVAYFGTWCRVDRLRRGKPASWAVLDEGEAAYDVLRPGARVGERLDFYVAASLIRIAEGFVTLWRQHAHLAPVLMGEALSRAEAASGRRGKESP